LPYARGMLVVRPQAQGRARVRRGECRSRAVTRKQAGSRSRDRDRSSRDFESTADGGKVGQAAMARGCRNSLPCHWEFSDQIPLTSGYVTQKVHWERRRARSRAASSSRSIYFRAGGAPRRIGIAPKQVQDDDADVGWARIVRRWNRATPDIDRPVGGFIGRMGRRQIASTWTAGAMRARMGTQREKKSQSRPRFIGHPGTRVL